jgi:hypothetical protein
LIDLLRHKYAGRTIDLIITVHGPALKFLLDEGKEICPNVPVVSLLAPETIQVEGAGRQIVSMPIRLDMRGTMERALELFPETGRVVYVGGFSEIDRRLEREARSAFAPWQGKLEFEYAGDLSVEEMLRRVGELPRREGGSRHPEREDHTRRESNHPRRQQNTHVRPAADQTMGRELNRAARGKHLCE